MLEVSEQKSSMVGPLGGGAGAREHPPPFAEAADDGTGPPEGGVLIPYVAPSLVMTNSPCSHYGAWIINSVQCFLGYD
jgi:hypothetical protein